MPHQRGTVIARVAASTIFYLNDHSATFFDTFITSKTILSPRSRFEYYKGCCTVGTTALEPDFAFEFVCAEIPSSRK
jgi:hypothetical protein